MSLSQLANAANAAADDVRRREVAQRRARVAANCDEKVRELIGSLDVPIVTLNVERENVLNIYHKGAYNESRSQESHAVHRYRVDDVVLRLEAGTRGHSSGGPYSPEIGYVAVERTCTCGRAFGVEIPYYAYTGKMGTPDTQAERFVKSVGGALRKDVKCTFCAADVQPCCRVCGHSNL